MQNIIITGASHGIGRALTKKLSKKYHIINIDIVENKMDKVDFYKCDLSDKSKLLKTIEKSFNPILKVERILISLPLEFFLLYLILIPMKL